MRALVTGAAGFIGSTLADRLVRDGWSVRGVDCFTPYYDESVKRSNLAALIDSPLFELVEADLLEADLAPLFEGVDAVFHQSGQPGVRLSWAEGGPTYVDLNINVTQRLLEAARSADLRRFVYASSSSIYGDAAAVPTDEDQPTRPFSPYGVTKLAGELLCSAYGANFGVPTTSLRYFTVYGPRQRPDMATHRLIEAALDGRPFPVFGDGEQVRDFTFVDDIVNANLLAAAAADLPPATVCNVAGGGSVRLIDLVNVVGDVVGSPVRIDWQPAQPGDVRRTGGSIERAKRLLGWSPEVDLATGVARQAEWHRSRRG
ncbi:MAG TPA: NAD-dependent epimerase/dehydratase family protein [Ilumatobacter sp.]